MLCPIIIEAVPTIKRVPIDEAVLITAGDMPVDALESLARIIKSGEWGLDEEVTA